MNNVKRVLLTILLTITSVVSVNAASGSITTSTSTKTAVVGSTFTVTVKLSCSEAIGSWQFGVTYDNAYLSFFRSEGNQWHKHLLHRYSAMLECVLVVSYIVVIVVWVGKKVVAGGKYVACAQVRRGQEGFCRLLYFIYLFRVVVKRLTQFVSQIGVCVLVAHYFYGAVNLHTSVVCGYYSCVTTVGKVAEELHYR